jgi:hypothetical protein
VLSSSSASCIGGLARSWASVEAGHHAALHARHAEQAEGQDGHRDDGVDEADAALPGAPLQLQD